MPLVTFLIAAYQAERTLERAVLSAVGQRFSDFEVMVVNDGSTDGSAALCDHLAAEHRRVRVLHLAANGGAAAAMNCGWRASDSAYVAILDADDEAMPERLTLQTQRFSASPALTVLGGGAHFVDASGGFLEEAHRPRDHATLRRQRWHRSPFLHPTVMMRRSFLDTTGGYTDGLRLGEDYDLWMRGFLYPEFVYENIPEILVRYTTRTVQRWTMIRASARVRRMAGQREGRRLRGWVAAGRTLVEGAIEQTGVFAWRKQMRRPETQGAAKL